MLPTPCARATTPVHPALTITTLLLWLMLAPALLHAGHDPMLPLTYNDQQISGWLMSEKLDGVRGHWDGQQLYSKNGHRLYPPAKFTEGLPPFPLEGELWGGRGRFEQTVSIIRKQQPHDGWMQIRFAIFDVPEAAGGFTRRIEQARRWFKNHPSAYAFVIEQIPVRDQEQMRQELQRIEHLGGEGLVVRQPDALYAAGRNAEVLKVKNYQDAEAKVVAHLPGQGRNEGRLGALLVELENGTQFRIGSGFSDTERQSPPPVGAVVTFKFYGTYQSGIPKFPSFVRLRTDHNL